MNIKKQRYVAMILCIYFIFMSIFSLTFIIKEADHDCTGVHCLVCDSIHAAKKNLEGFSLVNIDSSVVTATIVIFLIATSFVQFVILRATLVTQKTRMDN